jgi:hypothetical protein
LGSGVLGETPHQWPGISTIDPTNIRAFATNPAFVPWAATASPTFLHRMYEHLLTLTVAHELGHQMGAAHHIVEEAGFTRGWGWNASLMRSGAPPEWTHPSLWPELSLESWAEIRSHLDKSTREELGLSK